MGSSPSLRLQLRKINAGTMNPRRGAGFKAPQRNTQRLQ